MTQPLTVLLTNITLSGRTGTEIQTRNIALELLHQGHRPLVYTPELGPIAHELRSASIPVVTNLAHVRRPIDIVHGHHLPTTVAAVAHFCETPAIFVCHDFVAWHDTPPLLPSIGRYVAVDEAGYDRLTLECGVATDQACILLNAIDTNRFVPGPALPTRPRRALAFAKNLGHIEAIRAACTQRAIALDVIGSAVGHVSDAPESVIPQYDLVFASGLSAMEAMACGRAVVVCDGRGLAGMCDPARFAAWRGLNFGLRSLRQAITAATIGSEIDRYDAAQAAEVATLLRAEGGLATYVGQLIRLYRGVLQAHRQAPHSAHALLRAMVSHLQDWYPNAQGGAPWLRERELLRQTIGELSFGVACAPLNTPLSFGSGEPLRWWQPIRGFSAPEDWGTWTDGSPAVAMVRVGAACELQAEFMLQPYLPDTHREISVEVIVNGLPLAAWTFRGPDSSGPRRHCVRIPAHVMGADGTLWCTFNVKNHRSPAQLGRSADHRALGLGLYGVTLSAVAA